MRSKRKDLDAQDLCIISNVCEKYWRSSPGLIIINKCLFKKRSSVGGNIVWVYIINEIGSGCKSCPSVFFSWCVLRHTSLLQGQLSIVLIMHFTWHVITRKPFHKILTCNANQFGIQKHTEWAKKTLYFVFTPKLVFWNFCFIFQGV